MRHGRLAFTEALVLIAVIAILMAILIPTLNNTTEGGKRAVCLNNLRQLTLAWYLFAQHNGQEIVKGEAGYDRPHVSTSKWKEPQTIQRAHDCQNGRYTSHTPGRPSSRGSQDGSEGMLWKVGLSGLGPLTLYRGQIEPYRGPGPRFTLIF